MAASLDRFLRGLANLSLLRQRRANSYSLIDQAVVHIGNVA